MLNEMQDLVSRLQELWEKICDEYYYGHIYGKVQQYVDDISGLSAHCYETEVLEWNDYSDNNKGIDDIAVAIENWIEDGFKFNVIGHYNDEDGDECTVDFFVTIPHDVYWKGPGAWVPFTIDSLWRLDGEEIEVEVRHVPCPMEVSHV